MHRRASNTVFQHQVPYLQGPWLLSIRGGRGGVANGSGPREGRARWLLPKPSTKCHFPTELRFASQIFRAVPNGAKLANTSAQVGPSSREWMRDIEAP